jgi:hypothetical protein
MVKTRVAVAAGAVWLFLFACAAAQSGYELLHVFAPAAGAADGFHPAGPLVEGADGWIYGLTQRYGEDPHSSVTDAGALFRFDPADPAGTYEVVFSLREYAQGHPGFIGTAVLDGGLVAAGDGNLYFATSGDCNESGVFKVVPSGPVTLLRAFGCAPGGWYVGRGGLVVGLDGALYTVATQSGWPPDPSGGVVRIALDGTLSAVATFPAGFVVENRTAFTALTAGSDGWLYGARTVYGGGGSWNYDASRLYRVHPGTGAVETLHDFPLGGAGGAGNRPVGRLLEVPAAGADIAFLGVTSAGGSTAPSDPGSGTLFRLAVTGGGATVTSLYAFTAYGTFDGVMPQAGLTRAPDGTVYGTTLSSRSVYRLGADGLPVTVDGLPTHLRPWAPILPASDGALYGSSYGEDATTTPPGRGRLFRLRPVAPGPQLAGLTLNKPLVPGCKPVTGTVTLSAPAPAGGLIVSLSDSLAAASTPATLKIVEGATSKTFRVTTEAVATTQAGEVRATLGGTTRSAPLTLRPIGVLSVALAPNPAIGGAAVAGTVKLECAAGPAPIAVELSSSDASTATVAPGLVVPAGAQSAPFTVSTTPVTTTKKPKITARANGVAKTKTLTVTP